MPRRGIEPPRENSQSLDSKELNESPNDSLCASLCKPLQKDTKSSTAVKTAENLVFDFEKERAIREIVDLLREKEAHFCVGLAEIIKKRLLERIAGTEK